MSADPDAPADPTRRSGGYVVRNMIYKHNFNEDTMEVATGWNEHTNRMYNQTIVPPADPEMHKNHPCAALNSKLLQCSLSCEEKSRLAYRMLVCNEQKKELMCCLTKNKGWVPSEKKWVFF